MLEDMHWKPELTGVVRYVLERYHDVASGPDSKLPETYEGTLLQLVMLGMAVKLDCLEADGIALHKPSVEDLRECISDLQANPPAETDWSPWP